jgi:glycosyltransferase involved in cell wall biosynthesis
MRVGVNLLALKPGRQGGVEHYARRLTAALAQDPRRELVLLLPEAERRAFEDTSPGLAVAAHAGPYSDAAINAAIVSAGIEVLWSPWVSGVPFVSSVPSVVTIADLQHEHLPGNFTPEDRRERDRAYFAAAHLAEAVITFSRDAADDVARTYGVAPDRVHPIHLGPGHEWTSEPPESAIAPLREVHGAGFLLYPAHTWPHKDHALLLRALRRLVDEGRGVRLVLTGAWEDGAGAVAGAIAELKLDGQVAHLGPVPAATLQALYALAGALVFPSRFEGFGMPLVEAMAAGLPILSSNATSLPEVGGDAALYFQAGDLDSLTAGLRRILDDATLRESLAARGRDRARTFSWSKTAAQTAAVFESALRAPAESPAARALRELGRRIAAGEAQADVRLAKMLQAAHEADVRLAKMLQASEEADKRGVKLEQAHAEAQGHLALIREYETLIGRIVAEVHSIRALAESGRPREVLGLAFPWEVIRVRRVLKHTVQRLKGLVAE